MGLREGENRKIRKCSFSLEKKELSINFRFKGKGPLT